MKIVIMEPLGIKDEALHELLASLEDHDIDIYNEKTTDLEEMIARASEADVLVIANNPLPKAVIAACHKLKMISVAFVGVDHIDLDISREKKIVISNAAGYCNHAVAELAIGLTLAVLRNIPRCDKKTRQHLTKDGLIGHELYQKTFGIVGTGAIGIQTARLASAFGCQVIAYSRTERPEMNALGASYVSLETLMQESDIISIHTPLNSGTHGLISESLLNQMKPSAVLINTARGPIVDNKHLSYLLSEHKIAGAGIDVFDVEPPLTSADLLTQNERAVLTPHVAYATHESILRRAAIVIENINMWLKGTPQNKML